MISNQILQSTIDGLKSITKADFGVTDTEGRDVASTADLKRFYSAVTDFANSPAESQEVQGSQFFKVFDESTLEYVLIITGAGDENYLIGKMAAFQLQNMLVAYKERYDKDNFMKNLLLDNLLLVDIYSRSKKLHIQNEVPRIAYIVDASEASEQNLLELARTHFGNGQDFVTAIDEVNVIVIKELQDPSNQKEILGIAERMVTEFEKDGVSGIRISFGTPIREVKEISRSYKEAKMALDVGKIFFEEKKIIPYGELGIGRLIYQLPQPLCRMFIKEVFGEHDPEEFDEETLTTIMKFFENSLNVSETSRQLFIHRNTLVYRLDKLQKMTGLDLRVFEDAITFRIALMVVRYMKYVDRFEF